MKPYTPEQVAEIDELSRENKEQAERWLTEKMAEFGLREVDDIEDLNLTKDEQKQIKWTRWFGKDQADELKAHGGNPRLFIGKREDGALVRVMVKNKSSIRKLFAADVFSLSGFRGHGGNHDFSDHELEGNIRFAMTGPEYPEKK